MLSDRKLEGNSHLPATDTQQEANHVGLLLLLDLFHVLEGTHLDGNRNVSFRKSRCFRCFREIRSVAARMMAGVVQQTYLVGVAGRRLSSVVTAEKLKEQDSLFNDLVCGTLEN